MLIDEIFNRWCENKSHAMHGHMERLLALGHECKHITEFGTRRGASTAAFIAARPETIVCYDIKKLLEVDELENAAVEAEVKFEFRSQSTINPNLLIDETDLLFIDTWHAYSQLKRELKQTSRVRKYIVLHDTEDFAHEDEQDMYASGLEKMGFGLVPAILEFLESHEEWEKFAHYEDSSGLTVLKRL